MGKIIINDMEFFACHGHYPEEKTAGTKFIINVILIADTKAAELSDNIDDALNYQIAYVLIKETIEKSTYNLIEFLGNKIISQLFDSFSNLDKVKLEIKKINPAMGGQIKSVGIKLKYSKKKYLLQKPSI